MTDRDTNADPVFVAGMPRSGTTWIARALAQPAGARYVHEPDNEKLDPFALWAKQGMERFPVLSPHEDHDRYARLWESAFEPSMREGWQTTLSRRLFQRASRADLEDAVATGRLTWVLRAAVMLQPAPACPAPCRRLLVKSVHSVFALRWIASRHRLKKIIVFRHPLNVLSSWRQLSLPDATRPLEQHPRLQAFVQDLDVPLPTPDSSELLRQAWRFGVLTLALEQTAAADEDWLAIRHEHICADPNNAFHNLASDVGVEWTPAGSDFLRQSDRPGKGFKTHRPTQDMPHRWRDSLDNGEVRRIIATLQAFPLDPWNLEPPA